MAKTKQQLEAELCIAEKLEKEREFNKSEFAIKLVQNIVFGACGIVLVAFISYLVSLAIKK